MSAKKKPAKRAAKKTAPKQKGWKGWRSLLIRLEPAHDKMLTDIMSIEHQKTAAGAIKIMLENYIPIGTALKNVREELQVEKYNSRQYQDAIKLFTGALDGLSKVKPVKKIQRDIFDQLEEEEEL